jgi:hypothetical protein
LLAYGSSAAQGDIQLFCAQGKGEFYRRHGFVSRPMDAPGMQFKPAG